MMASEQKSKKNRVGFIYLLMTQTNKEEMLRTQYYSMEKEAKVRELTI